MRPRIVIADDHQRARLEMREQLETDFDIVGEAANGIEAMELCLSLKPDILITDIAMPQLSGIEAIRGIFRQVTPQPHVVIVSGITEEAVVVRAIEVGASDYLVKPVDFARLKIVLSNLMVLQSNYPTKA